MLRVDVGVGAVERDADDAVHSFDAAAPPFHELLRRLPRHARLTLEASLARGEEGTAILNN